MELLKLNLQDAGRIKAEAKAAGKSVADIPKVSAVGITLDLLRTRGITGLYKGHAATMLRDVSFSICYFPLFANINSLGPRKSADSDEAVFWWSFISGCAAGSMSAFMVNPADVVKTRLQLVQKDAAAPAYSGIPDAFKTILRTEGVRAFWKGGLCRMIVIAPLYGIAQMVYFFGIAESLLGKEKAKK